MCKIIAFTDTKKLNLKRSINDIGNTLLKTESDGFGYAIVGKKNIFGEKTVSKRFKSRLFNNHSVKLPIVKQQYSSFGDTDECAGPGIFHGRTSTNVHDLVNTHPMQRPDVEGMWHLIHNGVVDDYGPDYSKLTDNDSEDVLFRLMQGIPDVKALSGNPMEYVEQFLEGYYAFAAIDPLGRLHIARDSYATLFIAWSESLNTFLFATTEGLLQKLNKMLDAKIGPIDEIEDEVYMVFEGNEMIHSQSIKPLGFTHWQAANSQASLGRELSSHATTDMSGKSETHLSTISLNGGEVVVRSPHHRPISEAEWTSLDKALDSERLDDQEKEYYAYRREIDNMDAGYTITDENGIYLKPHEFLKLDHIAQELCTIIRPDGTVVMLDEDIKGLGRLA